MLNLSIIKPSIKLAGGLTVLKLKKNAPTIMLVAGLVGVVGAGIAACRQTTKLDTAFEEANDWKEKVERAKEELTEEEYSEEDYENDKKIIFAHTTMNILKLYAVPGAVGAASIALIILSHTTMNNRCKALFAAYNAVSTAFQAYREKVIEKIGADEEGKLYRNPDNLEVDEEIGGIKISKEDIQRRNIHLSPYARLFDECSKCWKSDRGYNVMFIHACEQQANAKLKEQGHLFLNEVYDMLGIEQTKIGQVVGWVLGNGDDWVDFGLFDDNGNPRPENIYFIDGSEPSVWLDFNVDGVIYDLI